MRIVVVGGGIIGCSVAYEAARAGAKVTLLDAGRIAGGASSTSFAWTNATGKRPQSYFALNVAGMRAHLDLSREFGDAPWFKQTGSIEWYSNEAEWPGQKENADIMQDWGYGAEWITKTRLHAMEPEINLDAVGDAPLVYYPEEGWVDPALYCGFLTRAAQEKWGMQVHPFAAVRSVEVAGGAAKAVRTEDGRTFEADVVVNCTGAAANRPLGDAPVVPMASNVGILGFTVPLALSLRRQFHRDDLDVRPDGAGRLMIHKISVDDMVPELRDLDVTGPEGAAMMAAVCDVLPSVRPQDLEALRITMRPIPNDRLTCCGFISGVEGYYVAVTHSGVSMAPFLGKVIAEEIVHGRRSTMLADFHPDRFTAAHNGMGARA